MAIRYNRSLSAFKGSALVIGCSHHHGFCKSDIHPGKDDFFTLDINSEESPDGVFDITSSLLPEELRGRFKLTLMECIDYTAYNASSNHQHNQKGIHGFSNVWDMTSENGFIVIVGCPPEKNFREQVVARNLNYIELNKEKNKEAILIAKNQALNTTEIAEQLKHLEQPLLRCIEKIKSVQEEKLTFCDTPYEQMDSFERLQAEVMELRQHPQELIDALKKIYHSLYAGQTSLFKSKPSSLMTQPDLTIGQIHSYCMRHPKSRTAYALTLAIKHWKNPRVENQELFHQIHQFTYQHSSSVFGLFKQTNNLSSDREFANSVQNASSHSRTGLIRDALSNS